MLVSLRLILSKTHKELQERKKIDLKIIGCFRKITNGQTEDDAIVYCVTTTCVVENQFTTDL